MKEKIKVTFICQSKGGVGKSYNMWSVAQLFKDNKRIIFVDLDSATLTSSKRLKKLVGENRVSHYSILDDQHKIERESFLNMLELFSKIDCDSIYCDFGATEAQEFLSFALFDFTAETLKEVCDDLGIDLHIQIALAGNDTLNACLNYSVQLTDLMHSFFSVKWMFNMGLSGGMNERELGKQKIAEIVAERYENVKFATYGDLGFSQSSNEIIKMLTLGGEVEDLSFAGRLKFKEVMKQFTKSIES